MKIRSADDPRFHREIWTDPAQESQDAQSAIYYVENHNGQCSYAELATDFEMAAWLSIEQLKKDGLGNWTAPIAYLVRQTMELLLKAMYDTITTKGCPPDIKLKSSHNLQGIWDHCRKWLKSNGYKFEEDARLDGAECLIESFHHIDPSGDLFRFGISNYAAFGKQKSYDRVGIRLEILISNFKATIGFLRHWEAVPFREIIGVEMGWTNDPFFNPEDFPRKSESENNNLSTDEEA